MQKMHFPNSLSLNYLPLLWPLSFLNPQIPSLKWRRIMSSCSMRVFYNSFQENSKRFSANHEKPMSTLPNKSSYFKPSRRLSRKKKQLSSNKSSWTLNSPTKCKNCSKSWIKCRRNALAEIRWRASTMNRLWWSVTWRGTRFRSCRVELSRWTV